MLTAVPRNAWPVLGAAWVHLRDILPSKSDQPQRNNGRGAWVAQSVKRPTLAQVVISRVREFEPRTRLWADSGEPEPLPLFAPPRLLLSL